MAYPLPTRRMKLVCKRTVYTHSEVNGWSKCHCTAHIKAHTRTQKRQSRGVTCWSKCQTDWTISREVHTQTDTHTLALKQQLFLMFSWRFKGRVGLPFSHYFFKDTLYHSHTLIDSHRKQLEPKSVNTSVSVLTTLSTRSSIMRNLYVTCTKMHKPDEAWKSTVMSNFPSNERAPSWNVASMLATLSHRKSWVQAKTEYTG